MILILNYPFSKIRLPLPLAIVALSVALASCSSATEAGPDPSVIATTGLWTDVVSNLACDGGVDVASLVPGNDDPHSFEPSLAHREGMEQAALVVANGLMLEEGLDDTLDAVEAAGTPVFRVAEHVDTINLSSHGTTDAEGIDPHVWFDPQRVSAALPALAQTLIDTAGLDADSTRACLHAYQSDLEETDAEIAALTAEVAAADRKLVTNHDSLGYFADRYGFEIIGTVIPSGSTLAQPNPAQLEALAEVIELHQVQAIFVEPLQSDNDVQALASRVDGVEVVTLVVDADTYIDFLLTNAALISAALG